MLGVGAQFQSASQIQGSVIAGGPNAGKSCLQSTKAIFNARDARAVGHDAGAARFETASCCGVLQEVLSIVDMAALLEYSPCIPLSEQTQIVLLPPEQNAKRDK